ncbi:MAG: hypothetical protein ABIP93_14830 [Gemmatimonadaceae bacterium]
MALRAGRSLCNEQEELGIPAHVGMPRNDAVVTVDLDGGSQSMERPPQRHMPWEQDHHHDRESHDGRVAGVEVFPLMTEHERS